MEPPAKEIAKEPPAKPPDPPEYERKSFASVVAGKKQEVAIGIKTPSTFKGEPAVYFSKEDIDLLAEPFRYTLVGKFPRGRPSMLSIRTFFAKLSLKADYKIGLIDSKHILIELHVEEDYHRIWMRTQWNIFQFPLLISKWHVDFTPENESPMTPIWVALPLLPPHLFKKEALMSIANLIGSPMKIDTSTANLARPSRARVCVEIDATKTLPKRGWIGQGENGFWQEFAYEFIPQYCHNCHQLGHGENNCMRNEKLTQNKAYENKNNNVAQNKARDNNFAQNKAKDNNYNKGRRQEIKEGKKIYVEVPKNGNKGFSPTEILKRQNDPSSSGCKSQEENINEEENMINKHKETKLNNKDNETSNNLEQNIPVELEEEENNSNMGNIPSNIEEPANETTKVRTDIDNTDDNNKSVEITNSIEEDIEENIREISNLCTKDISISDNEENQEEEQKNKELEEEYTSNSEEEKEENNENGNKGWEKQGRGRKRNKKPIIQSGTPRTTRSRTRNDNTNKNHV